MSLKRMFLVTLFVSACVTSSDQLATAVSQIKPTTYPLTDHKETPLTIVSPIFDLSAKQIQKKIINDVKDRWQAAHMIYSLAIKKMQDNPNESTALLKTLSYEWHFPLAMLAYAQLISSSEDEIKTSLPKLSIPIKKDTAEALILLGNAFEMAYLNFIADDTQDEFRQLLVQKGLGLYDGLTMMTHKYDGTRILADNKKRMCSALNEFAELYLTKPQRDKLSEENFKSECSMAGVPETKSTGQ